MRHKVDLRIFLFQAKRITYFADSTAISTSKGVVTAVLSLFQDGSKTANFHNEKDFIAQRIRLYSVCFYIFPKNPCTIQNKSVFLLRIFIDYSQ